MSGGRGRGRFRRTAGTLLVVGGSALVLGTGWRYWEGARERTAARERWNAMVAAAPATLVAAPVHAAPPAERRLPGEPIARVRLPRLGIDEVVLEGVSATELNAAPGHHPSTPLPGEPGNAVISAHRDRQFFPLRDARIGELVLTETPAGGQQRWRITGRRVVRADAAVLYQTAEPTLTLTTCWPIRHIGRAPDRLILTAEREEGGGGADRGQIGGR